MTKTMEVPLVKSHGSANPGDPIRIDAKPYKQILYPYNGHPFPFEDSAKGLVINENQPKEVRIRTDLPTDQTITYYYCVDEITVRREIHSTTVPS